MTQLVLEIPRKQDLEQLLAFLQRLEVRVISTSVVPTPAQAGNDEEEVAFILAGLPEKPDFETYVRELEESRKDKPLPGREN